MIKKQLTMTAQLINDIAYKSMCFNSWKELHMHLFEHGLYPEFQVFDDGKPVLHYIDNSGDGIDSFKVEWDRSVPGSVLFEIVNKHASAKL